MGIIGIGTSSYNTGYQNNLFSQKTGADNFGNAVENVAGQRKGKTVYTKTDDMLFSGGNGTGLSCYIKYADNSTEDNPVVVVKGIDENGNDFEKNININDINPSCATVIEMWALEAHHNVDRNGGLSSLPGGYGEMGLNDTADFLSMFRKVIDDMKILGRFNLMSFYMKNLNIYSNLAKR